MEESKRTVNVQGEECEVLRTYGNGGIGFIEGVGTARLGKKKFLSPRDKIIGDLKAMGKKNTEIAKILHGDEATIGKAISVGITAKDPKVMNYTDEQHSELVTEAKERLLKAVPKAADNVIDAINEGDLVPSMTLLKSVGAINTKKDSGSLEEVKKFGDWLMEQRRVVGITAAGDSKIEQPRELVTSASEINDPVEGERMTDIELERQT